MFVAIIANAKPCSSSSSSSSRNGTRRLHPRMHFFRTASAMQHLPHCNDAKQHPAYVEEHEAKCGREHHILLQGTVHHGSVAVTLTNHETSIILTQNSLHVLQFPAVLTEASCFISCEQITLTSISHAIDKPGNARAPDHLHITAKSNQGHLVLAWFEDHDMGRAEGCRGQRSNTLQPN